MKRQPLYRTALTGLVIALLLRAAIPVGYMPASFGSGSLFEMCPSAVPADLLAAISGAGVAHHSGHHAHHGGTEEAQSAGQHFDASHCPIGQMLSAAVAFDHQMAVAIPHTAARFLNSAVLAPGSIAPTSSRSRDPPA